VAKDGRDVVKLTDVGLTKREDSIGGTVLGSPVYLAPEVLVPRGIYDRKADIYALGIMLWETSEASGRLSGSLSQHDLIRFCQCSSGLWFIDIEGLRFSSVIALSRVVYNCCCICSAL
jgi:serine/threonine protein kinase